MGARLKQGRPKSGRAPVPCAGNFCFDWAISQSTSAIRTFAARPKVRVRFRRLRLHAAATQAERRGSTDGDRRPGQPRGRVRLRGRSGGRLRPTGGHARGRRRLGGLCVHQTGHDVSTNQRAFAALVRRRYDDAKTALNRSARRRPSSRPSRTPRRPSGSGPSPSVAPSRVSRCRAPGSRSTIFGPRAGIRLRRHPTNPAKILTRRRGRRVRSMPITGRSRRAVVRHAVATMSE